MPRFALALAAALTLLGSAAGQSYPIKIKSVKIGFPHGPNPTQRDDDQTGSYVCKANTWAPVYVELQVERKEKRDLAIVLETTDPDDLGTSVAVPLQNLSDVEPGTILSAAELAFLPCVRIGGRELTVTVREREPAGANPTGGRQVAEPKRLSYVRSRDTSTYVVLSLGSRLPGFEVPAEPKAKDDYRPAKVEQAVIDNPFLLPDRWYGYDGADLVVLATGSASVPNFLTPLFTNPQHKPRLDALVEWIRRGGRVVVSVGSNAGIVASFPLLQEILPMQVRKDAPNEQVKNLLLEWVLAANNTTKTKQHGTLIAKTGTFSVANFAPQPGRGARQIVPPVDTVRENARLAVVQAPYGLGRVTLVGFDLDRSPFLDHPEKAQVWEQILRECGSERATQSGNKNNYGNYGGVVEDELATDIRQHTDSFASVPVISFGWVAVFIVLYTLLIGPVEYFVLKKVFKRLELTWITFPIIVLTVSAIAYFSAYALKGSDMKVNKVDLLDIDPATNRIYGHTWFTVFSPRIDTYKVGVEPSERWAAGGQGSSLVDWAGAGSGRKSSFFRRSYFYQLAQPGDATAGTFSDGLVNVPIQVWSTKAFAADWSGQSDRQAPLVASELNHPPAKPDDVVGTFTLNLPFPELQDVYLIYAGEAYKWDAITSGVPVNAYLDRSKLEPDWLRKLSSLSGFVNQPNVNPRSGTATKVSTGLAPIFAAMFHDEAQRNEDTAAPRNATLRRLDQSWRLSTLHRDEILVIGRVPIVRDQPAEDLMTDPASPSPTKLWLRDLPVSGKKREPQQGTLQQETFVRVYVPVKPFKK
ncbi:hypothetical protein [Limnoglobus roseus]|nr:hypothetical protein [Limnoglobus roseus]